MPLTREAEAVVFIVVPKGAKDGETVFRPIGTGFIVRYDYTAVEGLSFEYVVTAAHVLDKHPETYVRFRTVASEIDDVPVPEWFPLPGSDVAVAPIRRDAIQHLAYEPLSISALAGPRMHHGGIRGEADFEPSYRANWEPRLGERVYFVGLFSLWTAMGDRNVPMVRSGTLGAMYQPRVPIGPRFNRRHIEAHLIDCRSHGGFSGSPCFVQGGARHFAPEANVWTEDLTLLLGLISAHFDDKDSTRTDEVDASGNKINAGVGVVSPVERIMEALEMDDLREERARIEAKHRSRDEKGATLDTVEQDSEYERFEDLTRKLVNTPKRETDEPEGESG